MSMEVGLQIYIFFAVGKMPHMKTTKPEQEELNVNFLIVRS